MLTSSCQKKRNLDGNYFTCQNGEYTEVYFKNDSMRIASDNDWIKLSEWRKIDVKYDSLFFTTFGEWKNFSKAKIKYLEGNKIQLWIFETGENIYLKPINEKLNFKIKKDFWYGFHDRKIIQIVNNIKKRWVTTAIIHCC